MPDEIRKDLNRLRKPEPRRLDLPPPPPPASTTRLRGEVESLYPETPEVQLSPEEAERREEAKDAIARAMEEAKRTKDVQRRGELFETIGHALTRLGAARAGMRSGVDLSQLDLQKTDWRGRRQEDERDLEREIKRREEEVKEIDRDVQRRRDERLRGQERRADALTRVATAEWQAEDRAAKDQYQHELQRTMQQVKEAAAGDAAEMERAAKVERAIFLQEQANRIEGSRREDVNQRQRLIIEAGKLLNEAGFDATVTLNQLEESKPGFFDRLRSGFGLFGEPERTRRVPREEVPDVLRPPIPSQSIQQVLEMTPEQMEARRQELLRKRGQ